mgnify:CR=1 FL=1
MTIPQCILQQLVEKFAQIEPPAFGKIVFGGEISFLENAKHKYCAWAHDEETRKA